MSLFNINMTSSVHRVTRWCCILIIVHYATIMVSNKGIVCFIVFLDTENIWFGEIVSSLSQLLMKIT